MSFLDNWLPWRLRAELERQRLSWSTGLKHSEDDRHHQVRLADECKEYACRQRDLAIAQRDEAITERDSAIERLQVALAQREAAVRRADKVGAQRDAALARLRKLRTPIFDAKSDAKALVEKLQALHESSCVEPGLVMPGGPEDGPDHAGPQGDSNA